MAEPQPQPPIKDVMDIVEDEDGFERPPSPPPSPPPAEK
jgi:hypothetical protein